MSQDRIRKALSIESLLVWAYGEQMVHKARRLPVELGSSKGPLAAHSALWTECAPVDGGGAKGFDASEDAWRVHEQVMELKRQTVDCGDYLAASRYQGLPQYRGAEPPHSGHRSSEMRGPAMARSWPTNGHLLIDVRMLVIMHAAKATRPEQPGPTDFRFKPEQMVRHPSSKGGVYARGWFQHVTAVGILPGDVAMSAATYQAWFDALAQLQRVFTPMMLTMFLVNADLPPPVRAWDGA